MKVNESWLREWSGLDADKLSAEALGEQLTMAGLEIDDMSPVAQPFNNVVVGEVLTLEQHPDADKLRVTTVDVGADEPLQIVCGAPNVTVGMKAPVATVGAVLPNGLKIKKSKLRGVASHGMLCGASEIDLEDSIDGLMALPADAPVGANIRDYLQLDENIYDVSITPNRGDCFSVRGLARELAVINELTFTDASYAPVTTTATAASINIQRMTDDCPRYLAQKITGINPSVQTPAWLAQRLSRSGLATHSLMVDVTNYVLMELGQPLHAFDADKITGDICIRYAQNGEKLTLLNEQNVTLTDDVLVIADDTGAIAIAGIMGGMSTAVTESTSNILLESAHFSQLAIAGRARRFGLHTDASQRFERGVDFELPDTALNRAAALILEIAGGEASPVLRAENTAALPTRHSIALTQTQIKERLGFDVPAEKVLSILNSLGIHTVSTAEKPQAQWQCTPPSHRFDISIPVDLIEEIVRIYGYDHIPTAMPSKTMQLKATPESYTQADIAALLCHLGYQEAISFSFSDAKLEQTLCPHTANLALANPISADLAVMRSTLLSSLLPCVSHNINRKQQRVRLFEMGLRFVSNTQHADNTINIDNLAQIPTLALVATGDANQESWHEKSRPLDFYDIKHDVNQLFVENGVSAIYQPVNPDEKTWLHPGQSADILVNGECIGYVGALHPSVLKALDLPQDASTKNIWVSELDIAALTVAKTYEVTALPRFPQVRRDIAILVDENLSTAELMTTIYQHGGNLLQKAWLFDKYKDENMPKGRHSLAFALLWQDYQKTMADEETQQATNQVIQALAQQHGATLRD